MRQLMKQKGKLFVSLFSLVVVSFFMKCTSSGNKAHFSTSDSLVSKESEKVRTEILRVLKDTTLFKEGLAWIGIDGKMGVIDRSGKQLTPLKYDHFGQFHNGFAIIAININGSKAGYPCEPKYRYGFIDKTGKETVSPKYDNVNDYNYGIAKVQINGKFGFIDETGKEIVSPKYDEVTDFNHGVATVKINGTYILINKTGKEVSSKIYTSVGNFSEGLAVVKYDIDAQSYRYGYIDTTGNEVIPTKYDAAEDFSKGLAKIQFGGKYGYINKTGKEVIEAKYDRLEYFSEGLAAVSNNNKYGFIDTEGHVVIPIMYDYVDGFYNGLAEVNLLNNYDGTLHDFFIDRTGQVVKSKEVRITRSTTATNENSGGYDLSNTTKTCTWCGKTFSGKAWTVSLGEPIQWKNLGCCSRKCAVESYNSQRH